MQREADCPCPLCGTLSECWSTGWSIDGGGARYFKCPNSDCGPCEISEEGGASLRAHSTLNRRLSRNAVKARHRGMVLRLRRDTITRQLLYGPISPAEVGRWH